MHNVLGVPDHSPTTEAAAPAARSGGSGAAPSTAERILNSPTWAALLHWGMTASSKLLQQLYQAAGYGGASGALVHSVEAPAGSEITSVAALVHGIRRLMVCLMCHHRACPKTPMMVLSRIPRQCSLTQTHRQGEEVRHQVPRVLLATAWQAARGARLEQLLLLLAVLLTWWHQAAGPALLPHQQQHRRQV